MLELQTTTESCIRTLASKTKPEGSAFVDLVSSYVREFASAQSSASAGMEAGWSSELDDTLTAEMQNLANLYRAPRISAVLTEQSLIGLDTSVIQVWEGTVKEVDKQNELMHVVLSTKSTPEVPPHTGEIELEWVSDQDKDLVARGAVFYLTQFKRIKRGGSIENSLELRFRRLPNWSATQIKNVENLAAKLGQNIAAGKIAD